MATQNYIQNTESLQQDLKVPTNSKARSFRTHICSCRPLAQDTGVVHQFTETAIFIVTPVKKYV